MLAGVVWSQVRFEVLVEAMTRAFVRCGCGLWLWGTVGWVVQWMKRETRRAARRGLRAKERSRWTLSWRNVVEVEEKDIVRR